MNNRIRFHPPRTRDQAQRQTLSDQAGGGLLAVIAALGLILALSQGTMYYRSKASAKFLGSEKNKVLAQQMAEAGIEDNIADIGTRRLRVTQGMSNYTTYSNKPLGTGTYTSKLTTVATGPSADTVDLTSTGTIGQNSQTVLARMRLRKLLDTTFTPILIVQPETTVTYPTHTVAETTQVTTVQDPNTMPSLNATPAYDACMASSGKKCDICHLPGGDISKANVINVAKSAINTHISHHGDYVTTDGTCDIYKPKTVTTIKTVTKVDTTWTVVNHSKYDTTVAIDTMIKVQILSWR